MSHFQLMEWTSIVSQGHSDWFKNGLQVTSQINETQVWNFMDLERTPFLLCDRQNLKDGPQDSCTLVTQSNTNLDAAKKRFCRYN